MSWYDVPRCHGSVCNLEHFCFRFHIDHILTKNMHKRKSCYFSVALFITENFSMNISLNNFIKRHHKYTNFIQKFLNTCFYVFFCYFFCMMMFFMLNPYYYHSMFISIYGSKASQCCRLLDILLSSLYKSKIKQVQLSSVNTIYIFSKCLWLGLVIWGHPVYLWICFEVKRGLGSYYEQCYSFCFSGGKQKLMHLLFPNQNHLRHHLQTHSQKKKRNPNEKLSLFSFI